MPPKKDYAENAFSVYQQSVGEKPKEEPPKREKNSAAVELGRKGGKARAAKLTKEQKSEQARNAAKKRWARDK